jgi:signal transduction histidine kinase
MRRHVDRELARARIASGGRAAACDPAQVLARLVAVLRRTRDGARVDWQVDAPPGLSARIDADDLTEALGALLENAARHAAGRVQVSLGRADGRIAIAIVDDGPGIPEAALARLTARGARLDTGGPGAGLGLAIASEIAEAAGGSLALEDAAPGLRAVLRLPAVPSLTPG